MMELTTERIQELRDEHLPRAYTGGLDISVTGKDSPRALRLFNSYLADFCLPNDKHKCVNCGWDLGGILSSLSWGIVWGEATCSCGWPVRVHHKIPDENGDDPLAELFSYALQYHPTVLSIPTPVTDDEAR